MDFVAYRNHVYRVYYLSLHLSQKEQDKTLALAAAFHDLGLWTAHTFDYLSPTIQLSEAWLAAKGHAERTATISRIIDFHHQVRAYRREDAEWVEPFRKADWIDLCFGLRYGKGSKTLYKNLKKAFPFRGFHRRLLRFFLRNLVRHPLRPFPMFR